MYDPNDIRLMEIICFERKAFEEFAMKIERFIRLVSDLPHLKDAGKTAGWLDHCDVCRKLKISKRTLQTLRDNGTLAYTKIGNVEHIVTKVEDRRREARSRGREI